MKPPGFGRIYKRKQTWWIEIWHRGRQIRFSSGTRSKTKASLILRDKLADLGKGVTPSVTAEKLHFDELAKLIEEDYVNNARKSTPRMLRAFKHLRREFGGDLAVDITSRRIASYVSLRRGDGASSASIKMEIALLRRAFNLAIRAGYLPGKPSFPSVQVRNTRSGFFEDEEFRAVYRHLPVWVQPIVEFMYLTGWRTGEVVSLRWSQVDFRAGTVRLEPGTTKNDEGRIFPVPEGSELRLLLERQRSATSEVEREVERIIPHVFHWKRGRPLKSFRKSWVRACELAGVPGRIPHDFRRTAVRNLERAGVPRSVAMKLTGHKTESVYRRYAIVSETDLALGVARVEQLRREERARSGMVSFPGQEDPRPGSSINGSPASGASKNA